MPRFTDHSLLALAGLLAACTTGGAGLYVPMPDAQLSTQAANPEGVPYPTANLGGAPRSGATPGQTFPNLVFEGIRALASVDTLAVVSMSELFDPTGVRYDLLHVIGIFMWCPHCNNETSGLVQAATWRADHRVAVIQIAMEGYGSASPGWNELQKWVRDHKSDFPVVVDGQGAQLGQYFPVDSVPLNVMVNPRNMEILAVQIGEVGDVAAYEQLFLTSP